MAAAFLVLEFLAGNGRIPHAVFAALVASLPPPCPRNSSRLRKALALRALDAALHAEDAASTALLLLGKAREVLSDPYIAASFPELLPFSMPDNEVTAEAAMADLKRNLDREWASLPPSTLELAADRIAGAGALETWARADGSKRRKLRHLVGDSMGCDILAKLGQDAYASHPSLPPDVDKSANVPDIIGANKIGHVQGDVEAVWSKKNNEAVCAQEAHARPQQESIKGAVIGKVRDTPEAMEKATTSRSTGQSSPYSTESHRVSASKHSLMARDPRASTYEWDGLGHSDDKMPLGHRQLPPFERKPKPSPTVSQKSKKRWSKIQEKTLLEGVEKYGKGNWKDIKMAYPGVFEDRSTVDLKDKFRNMERHQSV